MAALSFIFRIYNDDKRFFATSAQSHKVFKSTSLRWKIRIAELLLCFSSLSFGTPKGPEGWLVYSEIQDYFTYARGHWRPTDCIYCYTLYCRILYHASHSFSLS